MRFPNSEHTEHNEENGARREAGARSSDCPKPSQIAEHGRKYVGKHGKRSQEE